MLRELAGVDCGRYAGISFTQHYKSILINVVVDEHDGVFGLLDEADDVGVGIKDLAVVEDLRMSDHLRTPYVQILHM